MPAAQSSTTRARDLDRSTLCAVLDTAYADGQLDTAEHRARTTAAMAAKTLGQLRALADDLQVENALPPLRTPRAAKGPVGTPSRRRRIATGLVVSLLLLGAGFGIGYASGSSGSPFAAGGGSPVVPMVAMQQGLHTPEGFTALVDATRDRFGSTTVAGAVIYPDYAVITMPVPDAPTRAQSFLYRGGFGDPSNAGTRTASDPLVDLAAVRVDAILGLVAGAGQTLAVVDPTTVYMIVGQDGDSPNVRIHASNEFNESGFVQVALDGTVMAVNPYEAG